MSDPIDVVTVEEAAAMLNLGNPTEHMGTLPRLITAVSAKLDGPEMVGPVVKRTITDELHHGSDPWGCRRFIILEQTPVFAVTAVTEYLRTVPTVLTVESNTSAPASGFRLVDPDRGKVARTAAGIPYSFADGTDNVKVTYTAGRFDDVGSVEPLFKEAAGILLAGLWGGENTGGSQTFGPGGSGLPFTRGAINRARDLLSRYLRVGGVY